MSHRLDRSSPFRELGETLPPIEHKPRKKPARKEVERAFSLAPQGFVESVKDTPKRPSRRTRYQEYLVSEEWKLVRREYFARFPFVCADSGPHDGPIQLHHKTYKHLYHELRHLGDLQALCRSCHQRKHDHRRLRTRRGQHPG